MAEVVEPRYDELFRLIYAELRRSGYEELMAAGVVLTGGTSRMEGVVELAEKIFDMPVRLGVPQNVEGLVDVVINPIYATSVGLLQYAQQNIRDPQSGVSLLSSNKGKSDPNLMGRMKRWFQNNF